MSLENGLSMVEIAIGLAALVVGGGAATIVFRIVTNKRSNSQSQRVGNNSIGIQSGRDSNVNGK